MPEGLSAGLSSLDEAHGKWIAGDRDGALRLAIAVLEADPGALAAGSLAAQILVASKRPILAGEVAARAVDGFVRRGDFASAAVAASIAAAAEEDPEPLRGAIARAFGKGSKRVTPDASPAPPPLPPPIKPDALLGRLAGEKLLDRAEEALGKLLARTDPVPATSALPELPFVGALEPALLEKLLERISVRALASADTAVVEGDEGREAFIVVRGVLKVVRGRGTDAAATLAALGPGAIFGEMALVSDAPRAASVEAVEPAQLLVIDRADLEELAQRAPAIGRELGAFCHRRMVSNLIRHSEILAAIDPAFRAELIAKFVTRTFEPGEALVRQGAESQGLFLIASGSVEVSGKDADGDRLVIARLGPGDVVGEISLVLRRPATADVLAVHPTVALELRRQEFQEAIRAHPTLLGELYELATKREEQTRSVVAQEALDVDDVVLL